MLSKTNEKKEKTVYDKDGGLKFMKNWPSLLRWVCLVPGVILVFILVRSLVLGPVLNILERNSLIVALYVGAITYGIPFMVGADMASAIAPKKRLLVGIITSIILGIVIILITLLSFNLILEQNIDDVPLKTHILIGLIIGLISGFGWLYIGVTIIKERLAEDNKVTSDNVVE